LKWAGDDNAAAERMNELTGVVAGATLLEKSLPQPPNLLAPLLDELIVFDDLSDSEKWYSWAPLPNVKSTNENAVGAWFGLPFGGPEQIIATGARTEAETGLKSTRRTARRAMRPGSEVFHTLCQWMAGGARVVLITRWRTGGRTNFDLVREFAQELSQVPAAEAWQRACLLAREAPIDPAHEPRLKRSDETGDTPPADHPFFWAGYLLVDTGPRPDAGGEKADAVNEGKADAVKEGKADAAKDKPIPPPAQPPQPAADEPKEAEGATESKDAGDDADPTGGDTSN
jgi:hypothetical protein